MVKDGFADTDIFRRDLKQLVVADEFERLLQ